MELRLARYVATGAALAGLAAAASWSTLLGWADYWARTETVAGTKKALALTPGQAAYYVQLGILLADEDPRGANAALARAVALNPSDARSWIELGLRAEADGQNRAAEEHLLRAAEIDAQFLPRWTLANYYFRRDDTEKFWHWAKAAASMLYSDPLPLFRLCGSVMEDGNLIERLEIHAPDTQRAYLSYLLAQNRSDLIGPSTRRLLERPGEKDIPLLLSACDRLIEQKRADSALDIWNALARTRAIPFAPLQPGAERILIEDNFSPEPTSHGFDWHLTAWEGVSASREESPPGLRLTFSGAQPESCEPLFRFLPVRESAEYEFSALYRTAGIPPGAGLGWRVTNADSGGVLAEPVSLSSESDARGKVRFAAPPACRLVRVALVYRRATGTVRIQGSIVLRGVELQKVAPSPPRTTMR